MKITRNYTESELEKFKVLALKEWSNVEFPSVDSPGFDYLQPILAKENNSIVGGLSFILYPAPSSADDAPWINTVLVKPMYRNSGIGTALVKGAMELNSVYSALYVLTSIPKLYTNLGWSSVRKLEGKDYILEYKLNN